MAMAGTSQSHAASSSLYFDHISITNTQNTPRNNTKHAQSHPYKNNPHARVQSQSPFKGSGGLYREEVILPSPGGSGLATPPSSRVSEEYAASQMLMSPPPEETIRNKSKPFISSPGPHSLDGSSPFKRKRTRVSSHASARLQPEVLESDPQRTIQDEDVTPRRKRSRTRPASDLEGPRVGLEHDTPSKARSRSKVVPSPSTRNTRRTTAATENTDTPRRSLATRATQAARPDPGQPATHALRSALRRRSPAPTPSERDDTASPTSTPIPIARARTRSRPRASNPSSAAVAGAASTSTPRKPPSMSVKIKSSPTKITPKSRKRSTAATSTPKSKQIVRTQNSLLTEQLRGLKLGLLSVKKERPSIDLTLPLPPASPSDDPLLLRGKLTKGKGRARGAADNSFSGTPDAIPDELIPPLNLNASQAVEARDKEQMQKKAEERKVSYPRTTPQLADTSPERRAEMIFGYRKFQLQPQSDVPSTDNEVPDSDSGNGAHGEVQNEENHVRRLHGAGTGRAGTGDSPRIHELRAPDCGSDDNDESFNIPYEPAVLEDLFIAAGQSSEVSYHGDQDLLPEFGRLGLRTPFASHGLGGGEQSTRAQDALSDVVEEEEGPLQVVDEGFGSDDYEEAEAEAEAEVETEAQEAPLHFSSHTPPLSPPDEPPLDCDVEIDCPDQEEVEFSHTPPYEPESQAGVSTTPANEPTKELTLSTTPPHNFPLNGVSTTPPVSDDHDGDLPSTSARVDAYAEVHSPSGSCSFQDLDQETEGDEVDHEEQGRDDCYGEFTGRFREVLVPTKDDPPTSGTRGRIGRWGRPVSPYPLRIRKFEPSQEDEDEEEQENNEEDLGMDVDVDMNELDRSDEMEVEEALVGEGTAHSIVRSPPVRRLPTPPQHLPREPNHHLSDDSTVSDWGKEEADISMDMERDGHVSSDGVSGLLDALRMRSSDAVASEGGGEGDKDGNDESAHLTTVVLNRELQEEVGERGEVNSEEDETVVKPNLLDVVEEHEEEGQEGVREMVEEDEEDEEDERSIVQQLSEGFDADNVDEEESKEAEGVKAAAEASILDELSDTAEANEVIDLQTDSEDDQDAPTIICTPRVDKGKAARTFDVPSSSSFALSPTPEMSPPPSVSAAYRLNFSTTRESSFVLSPTPRMSDPPDIAPERASSSPPIENAAGKAVEDDSTENEDGTFDLGIIKITSSDPKAAARAAAILKMYDYEWLPKSARARRRTTSALDFIIHDARRQDLLASGVRKSAGASSRFRKRHTLGGVIGDTVHIPGSPAITLPELLQDAQTELELSGVLSSTPATTRQSASKTRSFSPVTASAHPYQTPRPQGIRSVPQPVFSSPHRRDEIVPREWCKDDWKLLDGCFTDERLVLSELSGDAMGSLAPVDQVVLDNVVDRFVKLIGGENVLDRLGVSWNRKNLLLRTRTLQKKQRAGKVAPPTPHVLHPSVSPPATPDAPQFTPAPAGYRRRHVHVPPPRIPEYTSEDQATRSPSPPTPRYAELMKEAIAISEGSSALTQDKPDQPFARTSDDNTGTGTTSKSGITSRVKGLLWSYLPTLSSKNTTNPTLPPYPALPLPPPEVLRKPRQVSTPKPKPPPKPVHPKELVELHPAPPVQRTTSARAPQKPKRLVELRPAPRLKSPERQPVYKIQNRRSSTSVKDLVRSFEIFDQESSMEIERSLELKRPRLSSNDSEGRDGSEMRRLL